METRHRRRATLPNGQASGERGGHRRRRAEPNAGAGTPEVCPHRMTRNTGRAQCARTADPCNKVPARRNAASPPTTRSIICSISAATTSPPTGIELRGGVRLRCGPTLAELLLHLERRTIVALSRLNDDNLTVPLGLPSSCIRSVVNCTLCGMAGVGRRPGRLRDEFGSKFIEPECRPGGGQTWNSPVRTL